MSYYYIGSRYKQYNTAFDLREFNRYKFCPHCGQGGFLKVMDDPKTPSVFCFNCSWEHKMINLDYLEGCKKWKEGEPGGPKRFSKKDKE